MKHEDIIKNVKINGFCKINNFLDDIDLNFLDKISKIYKCKKGNNFGKFAIIKGDHHSHRFLKNISTTLNKKKNNYKITSLIRLNAAKKHLLISPFLLLSSAYYYIKYLLKN